MCEISGSTSLQRSEHLFRRGLWDFHEYKSASLGGCSHKVPISPKKNPFKEQVWLLNAWGIIFNSRHLQSCRTFQINHDCLTLNQSTLTELLSTCPNSVFFLRTVTTVSFSSGPVIVLGSNSKLQFYALRTQSSLLSLRTSWSFNISVRKILPGFFYWYNDQKSSAEGLITAQRLQILTVEQ